MKVVTGAISHETSAFTPVATAWESYKERFGYLRGAEIIHKFRGANTPIGGSSQGPTPMGLN